MATSQKKGAGSCGRMANTSRTQRPKEADHSAWFQSAGRVTRRLTERTRKGSFQVKPEAHSVDVRLRVPGKKLAAGVSSHMVRSPD